MLASQPWTPPPPSISRGRGDQLSRGVWSGRKFRAVQEAGATAAPTARLGGIP